MKKMVTQFITKQHIGLRLFYTSITSHTQLNQGTVLSTIEYMLSYTFSFHNLLLIHILFLKRNKELINLVKVFMTTLCLTYNVT